MFKVQVIGNLGTDAEVREYQGKKFISFKVAHTDVRTREDGTKDESTVWIGCAYNGDGGNLLQYLKRGVKVYVTGSASLRVYSSKKVRGFVAGCDVHVESIELCGGSRELVPQQLATSDGLLHEVKKLYWCPDGTVRKCELFSERNEVFVADDNGFIVRCDDSSSEQSDEADSKTAC